MKNVVFYLRLGITMVLLALCTWLIQTLVTDQWSGVKSVQILYHPKVMPQHIVSGSIALQRDHHSSATEFHINDLDEFFSREYALVLVEEFGLYIKLCGITQDGLIKLGWYRMEKPQGFSLWDVSFNERHEIQFNSNKHGWAPVIVASVIFVSMVVFLLFSVWHKEPKKVFVT